MVPHTLERGEAFLTELTSFLILDFPRMYPFVSLEMSALSELVRALVTLKPRLPMVELVPQQGAPVTEQFPAQLAAEPLLVVDDPDMPVEMVPHMINLITVRAGETTDIRDAETVNPGLVASQVSQSGELLTTNSTLMFVLGSYPGFV